MTIVVGRGSMMSIVMHSSVSIMMLNIVVLGRLSLVMMNLVMGWIGARMTIVVVHFEDEVAIFNVDLASHEE